MPQPFTDPSYHLPAFYELWARWGPAADRAFWSRAADISRAFFVKTTNPTTGLAPVYANFDGTPHQTRFLQSTVFGYDSWRTASNWSVDWSWWQKAPQEQELSDRIQRASITTGRCIHLTESRLEQRLVSLTRAIPLDWWAQMPSRASLRRIKCAPDSSQKRYGIRQYRHGRTDITTACCI